MGDDYALEQGQAFGKKEVPVGLVVAAQAYFMVTPARPTGNAFGANVVIVDNYGRKYTYGTRFPQRCSHLGLVAVALDYEGQTDVLIRGRAQNEG